MVYLKYTGEMAVVILDTYDRVGGPQTSICCLVAATALMGMATNHARHCAAVLNRCWVVPHSQEGYPNRAR